MRVVQRSIFFILLLVLIDSNCAMGSEGLFVKRFEIVGNTVIKTVVLEKLVRPYEGKRLTLKDLKFVASLITRKYIAEGYVTSMAYIPPQRVKDGLVRIRVVEGKVGRIEVIGNHPYYSSGFIKGYFAPLVGLGIFNHNLLERQLLLLNSLPGLEAKATLVKGRKRGTTDIVIKTMSKPLVSATVGYNNFGSEYTSRDNFSADLGVGNIGVTGATLSLGGTIGDNYSEFHSGRFRYRVPVGVSGLEVGVYLATGDYNVGRELAILNIKGESTSYGAFLRYPFVRMLNVSVYGTLGVGGIFAKQLMLGEVTSEDRIRTADIGVSCVFNTALSKNSVSFQVTQGLGKRLGGMPNNDVHASRVGVASDFTKFNLSFARMQRLLPFLFLFVRVNAQYSHRTLISAEEFYIGGATSVRGYTASEYGGDSGYTASVEFRVAPLRDRNLVQFAVFADNGGVFINRPMVGQKKSHVLTGVGFGVRLGLLHELNVRADVGFPVKPAVNADGKGMAFYFQAVKTFR